MRDPHPLVVGPEPSGSAPRPQAARPDVPGDPAGGGQAPAAGGRHAPQAPRGRRIPGGYLVYGHYDDAFVITRSDSDQIVGCFYGEPGKPGWWRGHTRGVVRSLFLPGMEPLDVAERFLRLRAGVG